MSEKIFSVVFFLASLTILVSAFQGASWGSSSVLLAVLVGLAACPLIFRVLEPEDGEPRPFVRGLFLGLLALTAVAAAALAVRAAFVVFGAPRVGLEAVSAATAYAEGFAHGIVVLGAFAVAVAALVAARLRRARARAAAQTDVDWESTRVVQL